MKNEKQSDEHGKWQKHGQASGKRVEPVLFIEPHHLLLQLLWIVLVLLLDFLDEGLHGHVAKLSLHRPMVKREKHNPHGYAEDNQDPTVADGQVCVEKY